ncbi:MAG: Fic family protein [Clostridia bacterium]|nr:Fic family protein [Clostridia bacterium]
MQVILDMRAGQYINVPNKGYKAFEPTKLQDLQLSLDTDILTKVGEANRLLGKLEGVALNVPNIDLFISSYVRKEALMSSQIEGTQASLIDILDPNIDSNANMDTLDVVNYTNALNFAVETMKSYPLCNSLLKRTHAILLSNTRGQEKSPGEFRRSQNWIGSSGCDLNNARYVPPTPENMTEAMSDLEKFINMENEVYDPIIQAALIHYQFETIHPFLDGNGRIGRMLIALYLIEKKILTYPILYISYYLKKNRIEYYDRMSEVRAKGNYEQWVKFFLDAVIASCKDCLLTIRQISNLKDKNSKLLGKTSKSLSEVFNYICKNPIISIQKTAQELKMSFNSVSTAVQRLCALNILHENSANKRNRIFSYSEYLDILKKDTE